MEEKDRGLADMNLLLKDIPSGHPLWHELRAGVLVTSSNAAKALGVSEMSNGTRTALYQEEVLGIVKPLPDFVRAKMERGKREEPKGKNLCRKRMPQLFTFVDWDVLQVARMNSHLIGASADAILWKRDYTQYVFELKTPTGPKYYNRPITDHLLQVWFAMWVMRAPRGWLMYNYFGEGYEECKAEVFEILPPEEWVMEFMLPLLETWAEIKQNGGMVDNSKDRKIRMEFKKKLINLLENMEPIHVWRGHDIQFMMDS